MLKNRSASFSRSSSHTSMNILSSLSESDGGGGSPHALRRSKAGSSLRPAEESERRKLTKKSSLRRSSTSMASAAGIPDNNDLTESFTNQMLGLLTSTFGPQWQAMDEQARSALLREVSSAAHTFQTELMQRLQPQPKSVLQATTIHFVSNSSRTLCTAFSDLGLSFLGAAYTLLAESCPDSSSLGDAAIKIGNKMNEIQTFSISSSLYTQYVVYPAQIAEYPIKPAFVAIDHANITDSSLRSSIKERLRYFASKMSWMLSVLSSNCLLEDAPRDVMWLVAAMQSVRDEAVLITKLCKTLEASKKRPASLPTVGSDLFHKLSDSLSMGSKTTPTLECIVKLVKSYVRDALEQEISYQRAVLLILESRPTDSVWNILSHQYVKEKSKSEHGKFSVSQVRILDLITKWLKMEGVVIGANLMRKVNHFFDEQELAKPDLSFKTTQFDPQAYGTAPVNLTLYKLTPGVTLTNVIYEFTPAEVAQQMTIIARRHYLRLKPVSLVSLWWSKEGAVPLAEPITSFISHINNLADWAATLILTSENRRVALRYILKICTNLWDLEDFSSLSGVFSLFSMTSMSQTVQKALSGQSKRTIDVLKFFETELNPTGNFLGIRRALEKSNKDTAIPFLPTILSDLTMMNEFQDLEPDFSLNVPKYQTISNVLTNFFKFTTRTPTLTEIPALLSFIEALPCLPAPLLEKDHDHSP